MALDTFQLAIISTLQLHNAALILLLEKTKFDRADLVNDLQGQAEMLAALEDGQEGLAQALRGEIGS